MTEKGLSWSPVGLAGDGQHLLITDRGGGMLWWPGGPVVAAHGDGGPAAGGATGFLTSGGWAPDVHLWSAGARQPSHTLRPFEGRVTAACAHEGGFVVAGADPDPAGHVKEGRALQPSALVAIGADGKARRLSAGAQGEITALACHPDWILALDRRQPPTLLALVGGQVQPIAGLQGTPAAIARAGDRALIATSAGLWWVEPVAGSVSSWHAFDPDHPTVLALVAWPGGAYGATSEGLVRWPEGAVVARPGTRPASLLLQGERLLVLWEDGLLEQRERASGTVIERAAVPRSP